MATQYAGGGRRSEAPSYTPRAVFGTPVTAPDEAVVAQLLQAINAPAMQQFSGSSGGNISAGTGTTSFDPGRIGAGINVLGYGAQLAQNADLAQMASDLGKAFGVAGLGVGLSKAENASDVGKTLASSPAALNAIGLPGQLAGVIGGAVSNGFEGAATAAGKMAAYAAAPVVGLVDAGLTLAGMPTTVDMAIAAMKQAMTTQDPNSVSVRDLSIPEATPTQTEFSINVDTPVDTTDTTDTGTDSGFSGGSLSSGGYSNSWGGGGYGFGGGTGGMGD